MSQSNEHCHTKFKKVSFYLYFRSGSEAYNEEDDDGGQVEEEGLHQVDLLKRRVDGAHDQEEDGAWSEEGGQEKEELIRHVQHRHVLVDLDHRLPAL